MWPNRDDHAAHQYEPTNKDWNAANPHWQTVYARIRADFETDSSEMITAVNSANRAQTYEADVASQLSQADVDAIIAYYNSAEGARYEDFMRRIDHQMASGEAAHRDTSGYGAIGFIAGLAMRNPTDLAALDSQYGNDLSKFRAFEQTEASRRLFKAFGFAIRKIRAAGNPLSNAVQRIAQRHEPVWQALYKSQSTR